MGHISMKTAGGMLLTLWIFIGIPASGTAASPIWAPPPLTLLIEEGIAQNKEIKSLEDEMEGFKKESSGGN